MTYAVSVLQRMTVRAEDLPVVGLVVVPVAVAMVEAQDFRMLTIAAFFAVGVLCNKPALQVMNVLARTLVWVATCLSHAGTRTPATNTLRTRRAGKELAAEFARIVEPAFLARKSATGGRAIPLWRQVGIDVLAGHIPLATDQANSLVCGGPHVSERIA